MWWTDAGNRLFERQHRRRLPHCVQHSAGTFLVDIFHQQALPIHQRRSIQLAQYNTATQIIRQQTQSLTFSRRIGEDLQSLQTSVKIQLLIFKLLNYCWLFKLNESQVVQSRETINLLRSKYSADLLFMVMGRCEIKEPLDLAANSGLIVGVMKKEDPMGNTGRWFVDAGGITQQIPSLYHNVYLIYLLNDYLFVNYAQKSEVSFRPSISIPCGNSQQQRQYYQQHQCHQQQLPI